DVLRHVEFGCDFTNRSECQRRLLDAALHPLSADNNHHSPSTSSSLLVIGKLLMRALSTLDARKTRTRRGRIGTSCPVFGLRPTRCPLSRTVKLPNDEIFTDSPRAKAST